MGDLRRLRRTNRRGGFTNPEGRSGRPRPWIHGRRALEMLWRSFRTGRPRRAYVRTMGWGRLTCAVVGHAVDNRRFARSSGGQALRVLRRAVPGDGRLPPRASATRSPASSATTRYAPTETRHGHHEYICVRCGHPLLFEAGSDPYRRSPLLPEEGPLPLRADRPRRPRGLRAQRVHRIRLRLRPHLPAGRARTGPDPPSRGLRGGRRTGSASSRRAPATTSTAAATAVTPSVSRPPRRGRRARRSRSASCASRPGPRRRGR